MNFQLCRPAVTDPHKVRPCNYKGLQPFDVRIQYILKDLALYLQVVWRSSRLMDPLQNRTFCPVITRFHLYFTPNLTGCCGETMHTRAFPFTGRVGTGMQRIYKRYGAHSPIRSVSYRDPMQVKNILKFNEFSICRRAVTDPHKFRPCNYKGLQPYPIRIPPEVFRSTPRISLENQLLHVPPSEWSILTRIPDIFPVFTPNFDRLVWLKYAFPCLPIYRVGRYGQQRTHKRYGAPNPIRSLLTGLRCRSKIY